MEIFRNMNKMILIAIIAIFITSATNAQTNNGNVSVIMVQNEADNTPTFDELMELFLSYYQSNDSIRKHIADILRVHHSLFVDGGMHYNEQGDFNRATDFFEAHWNIPSLPTFAGQKDAFILDSTFQIIKYYAVISALQAENDRRAILLLSRIMNEPFIENCTFTLSDIYELLASTYQQMGNNDRFMETLQAGATKFPTNDFLVFNLIYQFIVSGDIQKAMDFIDRAVANNPDFSCKLISVMGALLVEKGDIEGGATEFRRALAIDAYCEIALESLARHYMVQAQDLREETWTLPRAAQREADAQILELYQAALPLLETLDEVMKGRNASEREMFVVLLLLRNVFYNLTLLGYDKSAEFDRVERRLPDGF